MNIPYDKIIQLLTNEPDWRAEAERREPEAIELFDRFSRANGSQCPFSRAAIKRFFVNQFREDKKTLIEAINTGKWPL